MLSLWIGVCGALIGSWMLTAVLRRYALARHMLDIPNHRSSHSAPTPRGGGVAIVFSFTVVLAIWAYTGVIDIRNAGALLGAGIIVALLGFLDDHGHVPPRWRLLGHFAAACWALLWVSGLPTMVIFGVGFDLGWIGYGLAALYLVWALNLYNFMDGIDGLASLEAICVLTGGALLYLGIGQPTHAQVPILLAFSVAGFLYWNFPPAKIFMGDAGSGFLGLMLGVMSLQAGWVDPQLFWGWLILLGVFVVDATLTLLRRLFQGEKVYEAHRNHAYQHAARQWGRHLPVTLAVLFVNVFWLFPLAWLTARGMVDGAIGLGIAYIPLLVVAFRLGAGKPEASASGCCVKN